MTSQGEKTVLYVLPATALGGAETRFHTIIRGLRGVRTVLLTHTLVSDYYANLDISVKLFEDYDCSCPMPLSIINAKRYSAAIADIVTREKIDIVFGVMHVGTFYSSIALDFYGLRYKLIGSILGNVSAFYAAMDRKPSFYENVILKYMLMRPSHIVVSSHGVKADLVANFGASEDHVIVVPNGIDISMVRRLSIAEAPYMTYYEGKSIVTACRLNAQKDFRTLLIAFKEVSRSQPARLIIVGDGELRDQIYATACELQVQDNVVFTGFQRNP